MYNYVYYVYNIHTIIIIIITLYNYTSINHNYCPKLQAKL